MLVLRSPAKINLFLRVLYKRDDGYHELASLFQAVDLFDTLSFSIADRDLLTCTDKTLSCGPDNFILKAIELFRKETGIATSFHIHLDKKIPQEAGLGGGSSNCATTLYALNELCKTKIREETLRKWSSYLCADAPFFFSSGTAYCEGIGERVTSLSIPSFVKDKKIYLFKPVEGLSTREIFSKLDLSKCSRRPPEKLLEAFMEGGAEFVNDLEGVAYQLLPKLKEIRHTLEGFGMEVFMTGSGSTHVGLSVGLLDHSLPYTTHLTSPLQRTPGNWY